jgi:hypothetical protein
LNGGSVSSCGSSAAHTRTSGGEEEAAAALRQFDDAGQGGAQHRLHVGDLHEARAPGAGVAPFALRLLAHAARAVGVQPLEPAEHVAHGEPFLGVQEREFLARAIDAHAVLRIQVGDAPGAAVVLLDAGMPARHRFVRHHHIAGLLAPEHEALAVAQQPLQHRLIGHVDGEQRRHAFRGRRSTAPG